MLSAVAAAAQQQQGTEATQQRGDVWLWDGGHGHITGSGQVAGVVSARCGVVIVEQPLHAAEVDGGIIREGAAGVVEEATVPCAGVADEGELLADGPRT